MNETRINEIYAILDSAPFESVWGAIRALPEYDKRATDAFDFAGKSDRFVAGGEVFRFGYQDGEWFHAGAYVAS